MPRLGFEETKNTSDSVQVINFKHVLDDVEFINDIDVLKPWSLKILEEGAVKGNRDAEQINIHKPTFTTIENMVQKLALSATILLQILSTSDSYPDNSILIELPTLISFQDLSKIANEFKIALEIPLNDAQEELKIEKAEEGTIWLTIVVSSLTGVSIIVRLTNLALKIAAVKAIKAAS